ncbi:RNAse Z [[Leptolyngbya] sp. PCC 7376]|uniref:ribonuclease Z n=1 Tax=[Leptolyngbya] sp. PCC 7376 TaxID=111781 RepID=UPI00029F05DC|nr:ribonuclease Z [[Leptolyngbya] sp. PCC 7376]AFY38319.1 RNAse Z [[Leptolyngbya] sp. PCC 7376]
MDITFLGTSSGVPTRARNVSSVALRLPQRAEAWLFDCGEGTQHQLLRSDLKSSQISRIFITHMHGDHIFGLMGLIASMGLAGNAQPINIYGPVGLKEYLRACEQYSHMRIGDRLQIHQSQPGVIFEDEHFLVRCLPLKHRVTAFGYRVEEKDRPGRFNVEKAKKLGIPPGKVYGELKKGKVVTLDDGRIINGAELCGDREVGRKMVYCTDTVFCDAAVELSQDADVLIHEATFAHKDAEMAFDRLHSTSTMAAQVALLAQVKQLIMTHFSPRYMPGNPITLDDLLEEAKAIFPNTKMARDFFSYTIQRRTS